MLDEENKEEAAPIKPTSYNDIETCTCSILDLIFQTSLAVTKSTKTILGELIMNFTQIA